MTNSPTTPEPETAKPLDQPRPFQFSIWSMMVLTAVVAGFFAVVTQTDGFIAFICIWFILSVAGFWKPRKYWKGCLAMNILLLHGWVGPLNSNLYSGLIRITIALGCFGFVAFIFVRGNRVDKVLGSVSAVLNAWIIFNLISGNMR